MKTTINILLLILILFSCKGKETKIDLYSIKEDSLIYELVDSLITPDSAWRKFQVIPLPAFPENYSKVEIKKQIDSLFQLWDTAKLFISIENKLVLFSKSYHSENLKTNTKEYLKYNVKNVDTSYLALFQRLVSDSTLLERRINLNGIHSDYNYTIIPSDSAKSFRNKGFRVVENYKFSRIIFNEKFEKACLYYQIICEGGRSGFGYILFLERVNGIWNIVEKNQLWI